MRRLAIYRVWLLTIVLTPLVSPCEQFGDGIISMIDCNVKVDKKEDPKGDRVIVTFE